LLPVGRRVGTHTEASGFALTRLPVAVPVYHRCGHCRFATFVATTVIATVTAP